MYCVGEEKQLLTFPADKYQSLIPELYTSKTEWSMAMRRHWKHGRKHWKVQPESLPHYILIWIIQLIRVCGSATEYLLKVNNKDTQTRHSYSYLSCRFDIILLTLTIFQYSYYIHWWNIHVKQFILVKLYGWSFLRK